MNVVNIHLCSCLPGLAGKNDWEHMRCDVIVDSVEDLIRPFMHAFRNTDSKIKVGQYSFFFMNAKFDKPVTFMSLTPIVINTAARHNTCYFLCRKQD